MTSRLVWVGLLFLCAGGGVTCATTQQPERAVFHVDATPVADPGPRCGQRGPVQHGAVPMGARENVRYHVTVSMPVALAEVEAVLVVEAARACADGVAVLQAVAADGAVGVTEVTAAAFVTGDSQAQP